MRRELAGNVVAFDGGNARRANTERACHLFDAARGCCRVSRAEVADDLDARRETARENRRQHPIECGTVAALRILPPLELAKRQRTLGQRLVHQKARTGLRGERVHNGAACITSITGKPGRCADENFRHATMLTGGVYRVKRPAGRKERYSSIGTMAASLELRSVSDVFTLRTLRAAVSFSTKA